MSYNKHTWATGNIVGAVDLNRMEQGIEDASGGGADSTFTVKFTTNDNGFTYTADKTFSECMEALNSFTPIFGYYGSEEGGYTPISCTGGYSIDDYGNVGFSAVNVFISDSYMSVKQLDIKPDNTVVVTNGEFSLTLY